MRPHPVTVLVLGLAALIFGTVAASAETAERRLALVIGNASYKVSPLQTPANDAGLIAQTLQAAGFDVVGARDLDADSLRHTFRDFLEKASSAGPDAVVFVYVAGYGVQYDGENYIVPVDAQIARDIDISVEAVRLSDYIKPLAALPLKARFVVLDVARDHPFARSGKPLASGLALVEAESGLMMAFNAAPGTVAKEGSGPYGPYAQSLAEMIREGGLTVDEVFERARLRVNDATQGGFVPWHASRISVPFVFFERSAEAPPITDSRRDTIARRAKPLRDFAAQEAYLEALDRDTLQGYEDFLDAHPRHALVKRVRGIVAARREAITWRRTYQDDTSRAYWSYLDRYPNGPHVWDARRRLRRLAAEQAAPPSFVSIEYDVSPPPREEIIFIERRVLLFSDPEFDFAPPPRLPVFFLQAPPQEFVVLVPPPPIYEAYVLPVPVFVPFPRWCAPPRYVVPPPNNVVFNNIHNTIVSNNTTVNTVAPNGAVNAPNAAAPVIPNTPRPHSPSDAGVGAAAVGVGLAATALAVSLPPNVAKKQALVQRAGPAAPPTGAQIPPLVAPDGRPVPQLAPQSTSSPTSLGAAPTQAVVAPGSATKAPTGNPPIQTLTAGAPSGTAPLLTNKPPPGQIKGQLPVPTQTAPVVAPVSPRLRAGSVPKQLPTAAVSPASSPLVPPAPTARQAKDQQSGPTSPAAISIQPPPQTKTATSKQRAPSSPPQKVEADMPARAAINGEALKQRNSQAAAIQAKAQRERDQAAEVAQRRVQQQQGAIEAQRRSQQQQAAQEAQRRTQQQKQAVQSQAQQQQQQAAQEAQRRAQQQQQAVQRQAQQQQQQAAQETQRRAQQQQQAVQRQAQQQQQLAQEAQRRAQQQQAVQDQRRVQQQQAAQETQRRAQQQQAAQRQTQRKACGVPGTPACAPPQ